MTRLLYAAAILCAATVALWFWARNQPIDMWDGSGL